MTVRGVPKSMRWALPLALAIALLTGFGASGGRATSLAPARESKTAFPPVLGMSFDKEKGTLAWFDPLTLKALRGRTVALGVHTGSWAFSPDRSVLVAGRCNPPEIRFVNARAMRIQGDLQVEPYPGCVSRFTWLRPDRLLATFTLGKQSELVVVDPVARRVIRRESLSPADVWASDRTRDALVLLLAGAGSIVPSRLAVIDAEGTVRTVGLDRILAGSAADAANESDEFHLRVVSPGLTVDPDAGRAFVVPGSGPVAEVDLATLEVSYHELDPPSPLGRFLRWLQPSAQAKGLTEGPQRQAAWLGTGTIAVSGSDRSFVRSANGEEQDTSTSAGLRVIDTRTWTTRMLDPEATDFVVAPGLVVAHDGLRAAAPGFRAFGFDGSERWRLPAAADRYLVPAGPLGYVYLRGTKAQVVELATGKVLGTVSGRGSWPQLLGAQSSG